MLVELQGLVTITWPGRNANKNGPDLVGAVEDCDGAWEGLRLEVQGSVAGYGFGGGFLGLGSGVAIASSWGDADWLVGVGEVCRNGLGDVGDCADLHHCRLGLLQNEFFVDGANPGLLLESHLAANAVLFGSGQRDVVLQVANARGVIGVDD